MSTIIVESPQTTNLQPGPFTPGPVIDTGAGAGVRQRLVKDIKQDYGAYGDGSHDDTLAIADAIDALAGTAGTYYDASGIAAQLYFPPGIYTWNADLDPVPPWVSLVGAGKGLSSLTAGGAGARLRMGERGVAGTLGQSLRHLTIDGAGLTTQAPLKFGRGSETLVLDVEVINSAADGVLFEEAQNTHLYNFTSQLHAGNGLMFDYGAAGISFYGFELGACGDWCIRTGLNGYGGGTAPIGQIGFYGGIIERSVAGSQGMAYLGQNTGMLFMGTNWADGSPLADIVFIKLRVDVPGPPAFANRMMVFAGYNSFHGAGAGSGYGTWIDALGNVQLYLAGVVELTGGFKNGIVYGGGSGFLIDQHGVITDLEGGIFGTALVDNSGTGTNIDALVRINENRSRTMIRYGTNRAYEQWFVHGDAQPQFRLKTDGKFYVGPGGAVAPTATMYSSAAGVMNFDGRTVPSDSVTIKTKAGAPVDGDFSTTPANGTLALDTTNNRLYIRSGGVWKYAALT